MKWSGKRDNNKKIFIAFVVENETVSVVSLSSVCFQLLPKWSWDAGFDDMADYEQSWSM